MNPKNTENLFPVELFQQKNANLILRAAASYNRHAPLRPHTLFQNKHALSITDPTTIGEGAALKRLTMKPLKAIATDRTS